MNRKFYFVVIPVATPKARIAYAVAIHDGSMALSEKMVRGRGTNVPLLADLPIDKVVILGEKVYFSASDKVIEGVLGGAFGSFAHADECYGAEELNAFDSRWHCDTVEVLEFFLKMNASGCHFCPTELRA